MKNYLIFLFVFVQMYSSCSQDSHERFTVEPDKILKNVRSWSYYQRDYLRLSENFIAFDSNFNIINKDIFFKVLASGGFLPAKLISKDSLPHYELYKLNSSVNEDLQSVIKDFGELEYRHYQMEGKPMPNLDFTDLDGNIYNRKTTLGKTLVVKCWFINCQVCIEEMPALNKVIEQYKNRKDILFLSLAFDNKVGLKRFLAKTTFNYAVVSNQENYILNELKITMFPTHLIINKNGMITKVVNSSDELLL